jgi:hypothetical protein
MSDPAPPIATQKSEADRPEVVWIPSLLFLRTPCGSINLIGPLPELFAVRPCSAHRSLAACTVSGVGFLIQTPKPFQASVAYLCRCLELEGIHDSFGLNVTHGNGRSKKWVN